MSTLPGTPEDRAASTPRYDDYTDDDDTDWVDAEGAGWLGFAAVMLLLGGGFGILAGVMAISRSAFYHTAAHYPFGSLRTWGWITVVVGAIAMFAGLNVMRGYRWARWAGIAAASLQAIAQLLVTQAYPFWSLALFSIDILVIYALTTRGGVLTRRG
ncbi:MAG TPA: hypothetical protein VEH52_06705 [Gaiellaceae bacterium]|jgi:hypothetical protein|nr:hypothetical protein [Gaiellaceae bacterium]